MFCAAYSWMEKETTMNVIQSELKSQIHDYEWVHFKQSNRGNRLNTMYRKTGIGNINHQTLAKSNTYKNQIPNLKWLDWLTKNIMGDMDKTANITTGVLCSSYRHAFG